MTEVPETEAGRALAKERDACLGVQCSHASDDAIIAIEAEARAAALERDEKVAIARALFREVPLCTGCDFDHEFDDHVIATWDAAIDALRERSDPITVKSIPGYGE